MVAFRPHKALYYHAVKGWGGASLQGACAGAACIIFRDIFMIDP
jgi:hypothetical protein